MSYTAVVENGVIKDVSAKNLADSAKTKKSNDALDKEAFLQLLVAQMQYQDPLEPTSNTEYISQLATFSELEAMTNLNDSMSIARASQLVGQKVTIQTTSASTGETTEAEGTVDYVIVENGKAYLVIDEQPYAIDDLSSIMTEDYWKEYQALLDKDTSVTAQAIMAAIASLPQDTAEITLEHADLVKAIRKTYTEMTTDEQQMVEDDYLIHLIKAENIIAKLEAAQKKEETENPDGDTSEESGKTDEAADVETV